MLEDKRGKAHVELKRKRSDFNIGLHKVNGVLRELLSQILDILFRDVETVILLKRDASGEKAPEDSAISGSDL